MNILVKVVTQQSMSYVIYMYIYIYIYILLKEVWYMYMDRCEKQTLTTEWERKNANILWWHSDSGPHLESKIYIIFVLDKLKLKSHLL